MVLATGLRTQCAVLGQSCIQEPISVFGYSAAHAYHLIITPGSQRRLAPLREPETARPTIDQCEPVSRSMKGASRSPRSTLSVTCSGFFPSVSGANDTAVRVEGSQRITASCSLSLVFSSSG